MTERTLYAPGPATAARVEKDGDTWRLVVEKQLRQPPDKVWQALIDPAQLREWAPFDADGNLGTVGAKVKLTTVGAPGPHVTDRTVTRTDPPKTLEYNWGGGDMRWELEPLGGGGTKLTLWANINKNYISMGAAGWHVCFDVLDRLLAGQPIGRIAGPAAMQVDGWSQLLAEYSKKLGVEPPRW